MHICYSTGSNLNLNALFFAYSTTTKEDSGSSKLGAIRASEKIVMNQLLLGWLQTLIILARERVTRFPINDSLKINFSCPYLLDL